MIEIGDDINIFFIYKCKLNFDTLYIASYTDRVSVESLCIHFIIVILGCKIEKNGECKIEVVGVTKLSLFS